MNKKKDTDKANKWQVVYWFTKKQWYDILLEERIKGLYIRDDILEIAKSPFDLQLIRELIKRILEMHNIETHLNFDRAEEKQIIELQEKLSKYES